MGETLRKMEVQCKTNKTCRAKIPEPKSTENDNILSTCQLKTYNPGPGRKPTIVRLRSNSFQGSWRTLHCMKGSRHIAHFATSLRVIFTTRWVTVMAKFRRRKIVASEVPGPSRCSPHRLGTHGSCCIDCWGTAEGIGLTNQNTNQMRNSSGMEKVRRNKTQRWLHQSLGLFLPRAGDLG